MIVSNTNKKLILEIIDDFEKLKIPIELSDQDMHKITDLKIKDFKFGSNLLNLLFSVANHFALVRNHDAVRFVIKAMQNY